MGGTVGSTAAEESQQFAGVVIFDDLDENSLTALKWAFDYLKIGTDYQLRIIHVIKEGNQDPPPTDDDMDWDAMEAHFRSRPRSADTLKKFQEPAKKLNSFIRLRVFKGEDSQKTLQDAITKSLRGLHTLVLGWPKQEDGTEPQKMISVSTTGCFIVVVPKKDASVTTEASVSAPGPAVAVPQASAATDAVKDENLLQSNSKNHSSPGEDGVE